MISCLAYATGSIWIAFPITKKVPVPIAGSYRSVAQTRRYNRDILFVGTIGRIDGVDLQSA